MSAHTTSADPEMSAADRVAHDLATYVRRQAPADRRELAAVEEQLVTATGTNWDQLMQRATVLRFDLSCARGGA